MAETQRIISQKIKAKQNEDGIKEEKMLTFCQQKVDRLYMKKKIY